MDVDTSAAAGRAGGHTHDVDVVQSITESMVESWSLDGAALRNRMAARSKDAMRAAQLAMQRMLLKGDGKATTSEEGSLSGRGRGPFISPATFGLPDALSSTAIRASDDATGTAWRPRSALSVVAPTAPAAAAAGHAGVAAISAVTAAIAATAATGIQVTDMTSGGSGALPTRTARKPANPHKLRAAAVVAAAVAPYLSLPVETGVAAAAADGTGGLRRKLRSRDSDSGASPSVPARVPLPPAAAVGAVPSHVSPSLAALAATMPQLTRRHPLASSSTGPQSAAAAVVASASAGYEMMARSAMVRAAAAAAQAAAAGVLSPASSAGVGTTTAAVAQRLAAHAQLYASALSSGSGRPTLEPPAPTSGADSAAAGVASDAHELVPFRPLHPGVRAVATGDGELLFPDASAAFMRRGADTAAAATGSDTAGMATDAHSAAARPVALEGSAALAPSAAMATASGVLRAGGRTGLPSPLSLSPFSVAGAPTAAIIAGMTAGSRTHRPSPLVPGRYHGSSPLARGAATGSSATAVAAAAAAAASSGTAAAQTVTGKRSAAQAFGPNDPHARW